MIFTNFGILDLSTPDLAIILLIVLLLFGSKKLPELSRSLGTSVRELRKGFTDIQEAHGELKDQVKEVTATVTPSVNVSRQQPSERPIIQG
jgi:sec-independent protein translocase protein TatA